MNIHGDFEEFLRLLTEEHVEIGHVSCADLLANGKASGHPTNSADFDELGGNRDA